MAQNKFIMSEKQMNTIIHLLKENRYFIYSDYANNVIQTLIAISNANAYKKENKPNQ